MNGQTFLRAELKYLLTSRQYSAIRNKIANILDADEHGKSTVQSLYYDTEDFLLIRKSLEKTEFKEKLRLRCYGVANEKSDIYVEIKRKASGLVYKRRVKTKYGKIKDILDFGTAPLSVLPPSDRITKEINFFYSHYRNLSPKILVLCDREAFSGQNGLRVTFDTNVRYRNDKPDFSLPPDGTPMFSDEKTIMEIKIDGAIPLWLSTILTNENASKTTFSKYGRAYEKTFFALPS